MPLLRSLKRFLSFSNRIFTYFLPHQIGWTSLYIIAIFYTLLGLANPIIVKVLIDNVLIAKDFFLLNFLIVVFIAITLFTTSLDIISSYFYQKLSMLTLFEVRNKLFAHVEKLDMGFFHEKTIGDILSRLTEDISGIQEFISLVFNGLFINILTVFFIFAISIALDWKLTLIAIATVPLIIITQRRYGRLVRAGYNIVRIKSADFLNFLQEKLSTASLTKYFSREEWEEKRQKVKAKKIIKVGLKLVLTSIIASTIAGLLIFASLLFVLWYGGYEVITGALTIGSLIAIYTYITMLVSPIGTLTDINIDLQKAIVSAKRVFAILDRKPRVTEKPGAISLREPKGEIKFENVNFSYEPGKPALKNISFEIKPGEKIGLVGGSGSGKTTIARLLVRLYDPEKGRILIDGNDIKDLKLNSLREAFGLVSQNVMLLHASIKENIGYGKPRAKMDEIVKAAEVARAHEFIINMPKGYATVVGNGDAGLSGGQAQRISIARALLKNPSILILDEATSALDRKTEAKIESALAHLTKDKTVLIITHKISTMKAVDRLFVLDEGRLVESGSFSQLTAKRGFFYKFYTTHFGEYHAFEERLAYELKGAEKWKTPLFIACLRITNLEKIDRKIGKEQTNLLLEKLSKKLALLMKEADLSTPDPYQRDISYVTIPRKKIERAKKVCKQFLSAAAKITPEFKFKAKLTPASKSVDATIEAARKSISL